MSHTPTYDDDALDRLDAELNAPTVPLSTNEPTQIGRYRIVEKIGEGGMGVVYKAQQSAPIERTVALKLIKLGHDTPAVVQRFAAERQALAWMDHPGIAKVLDAGAAPVTGQPYFVMEYVPGVAITRYCDEHALNNRERLKLLIKVCDAVAHAHQKLMVHRDLKPSNILVYHSAANAAAEVKVIDFGVAKVLGSPDGSDLTMTLHTEAGQLVGTPDYMSPEQARATGAARDVDTRADIYSLGVIMYELITGALPFDPVALRSAGLAGIERMICDTDPPRPHTRLSSLDESSSVQIAARRQTDRADLERQLRSELEWIPLKAMRKDREERYATIAEMADDLRNYLAGRPLIAAPESRAYRARKFLYRNRVSVAVATLVALLLIGGIVSTSWQARRANRERVIADEQRARAEARFEDVRQIASKFIFDIHRDIANLPGSQAATDKLLAIALEYLQKLEADSAGNFKVLYNASTGYQQLGDLQGHPLNNNRGDVKAAMASYERAEALAKRASEAQPESPQAYAVLASTNLRIGDLQSAAGNHVSAIGRQRQALAMFQKAAALDAKEVKYRDACMIATQRVAEALSSANQTSEAIALLDGAIPQARQIVSEYPAQKQSQYTLITLLTLSADLKETVGDIDGSHRVWAEVLPLQEAIATGAPDDINRQGRFAATLSAMAHIQSLRGKTDEAMKHQTRALEVARKAHGRDPENQRMLMIFATQQMKHAELLAAVGQRDEAMRGFDEALASYRAVLKTTPTHAEAIAMVDQLLAKRSATTQPASTQKM